MSLGQATLLAVVILSIPQLDLLSTADIVEWIFIILFPNYSLGQGINDLYGNSMYNQLCANLSTICPDEPNLCCGNTPSGDKFSVFYRFECLLFSIFYS